MMTKPPESKKVTVEHKGETYYPTGNHGTRMKDGVKGAEYASTKGNGKRLWVYKDGTTMEDNN